MVGPDLFIEIAEQTGLILTIGDRVLETACRWAQGLSLPGTEGFSIAVNVSPRQLQQESFPARVREILERTRLEPARLQLEITESMRSKAAAEHPQ